MNYKPYDSPGFVPMRALYPPHSALVDGVEAGQKSYNITDINYLLEIFAHKHRWGYMDMRPIFHLDDAETLGRALEVKTRLNALTGHNNCLINLTPIFIKEHAGQPPDVNSVNLTATLDQIDRLLDKRPTDTFQHLFCLVFIFQNSGRKGHGLSLLYRQEDGRKSFRIIEQHVNPNERILDYRPIYRSLDTMIAERYGEGVQLKANADPLCRVRNVCGVASTEIIQRLMGMQDLRRIDYRRLIIPPEQIPVLHQRNVLIATGPKTAKALAPTKGPADKRAFGN